MFDVRFRRVAVVLVTLAAGGLLAACGSAGSGGSSSSSTTAASASGSGSTSARRAQLAACLKAHGVTLPARPAGAPPAGAPPAGGGSSGGSGTGTTTTPRRGGGGFLFGGGGGFANNPKLRAAFQACGGQFGGGGGRGFRGRLSRTNITKYVTCVRQHGYNVPNPNFSGNGPIFPRNIQSNAKFQAASRACQSLLIPQRPPSTTSTTAGA
jgi:hypothetical protein